MHLPPQLSVSGSTSIRRPAAQPELEVKQLLDRSGAAQDVPLTADVSAPVSSWSQIVGNVQIRHAALVVSRAAYTVVTSRSASPQVDNGKVSGLQVAPLWFGAQLTFNLSLSMTNVTSNTILSSTSSFALSCLLLGEQYTFVKLGSIVVCIAGKF